MYSYALTFTQTRLTVAVLLLASSMTAILFARHKGVIDKTESKILCLFLGLFIILQSVIQSAIYFRWDFSQDEMVLADALESANLITSVIPIGVLLYIIQLFLKSRRVRPGDTFNAETAVREIFHSNSFYTAISTSLPIGKNDTEYGFDYIPFMLQNLTEKKNRFRRSSNMFLWITILLSLFFAGIAVFFGYVLLNESSVGINRSFNELKNQLSETDETIRILKLDMNDTKWKIKIATIDFDKLQNAPRYLDGLEGKSYESDVRIMTELYPKLIESGNFNIFLADIEEGQKRLRNSKDKVSETYMTIVDNVYKQSLKFNELRANGINHIESVMNQAKAVVAKADKKLDEPINTQNELIKRVVLSVVIISFFIAILRWFRSLYQNNYNEMLRAENEDLMLRKFYVAYRSATSSDERKQVLTTLLTAGQTTTSTGKRSKESEDENAVLKDVINAMLKKL